MVEQEAAGPDEDPGAVEGRLDAEAADGPEAIDLPEAELVLACPGEDRRPDRVLAPLLDRSGNVEELGRW